jgi:two-component system, OmpR family, alkaline phosphatase synthesis response regulator PhoP
MTQRILLVEDEPGLVMTLTDRLTSEGYVVEAAGDAETGLARASGEPFDLIILDIMLPGGSGFDVCRDLRQRGNRSPIIMLTARGQIIDKVLGLKIGADDYVTKPFEMMELLARVEVQLRRSSANIGRGSATPPLETYQFGDVRVDFRRAEAYRGENLVELSAKEFKLLRYLIEHRGAALSRDELLNEVWGYDAAVTTRTVDVHIAGLRQKLEVNQRHPEFILTIHGLGYKFSG